MIHRKQKRRKKETGKQANETKRERKKEKKNNYISLVEGNTNFNLFLSKVRQ